jgi:hypothetical protein
MYGQRETIRSRQETVGRDVLGNESTRPRKVAPWPWRTTPWNWSETRKQYEATRLKKSQIK